MDIQHFRSLPVLAAIPIHDELNNLNLKQVQTIPSTSGINTVNYILAVNVLEPLLGQSWIHVAHSIWLCIQNFQYQLWLPVTILLHLIKSSTYSIKTNNIHNIKWCTRSVSFTEIAWKLATDLQFQSDTSKAFSISYSTRHHLLQKQIHHDTNISSNSICLSKLQFNIIYESNIRIIKRDERWNHNGAKSEFGPSLTKPAVLISANPHCYKQSIVPFIHYWV